MIRKILRNFILTPNTLRYRIELRVILSMLREIQFNSPGILLDAGAGSGEMSLRLEGLGFASSLIGVEPIKNNFDFLKKNYGSKENRKCIQSSLDEVPLDNESVDFILSTQVFEHIPDDLTAAKELNRLLRPGGMALISTPHPPEMFPNDEHVRPGYTLEEMEALFAKVGWKRCSHRYFCCLPTLHRFIAAEQFGILGKLYPLYLADREKNLSQEEIKAKQPYGMACLFRKENKA